MTADHRSWYERMVRVTRTPSLILTGRDWCFPRRAGFLRAGGWLSWQEGFLPAGCDLYITPAELVLGLRSATTTT